MRPALRYEEAAEPARGAGERGRRRRCAVQRGWSPAVPLPSPREGGLGPPESGLPGGLGQHRGALREAESQRQECSVCPLRLSSPQALGLPGWVARVLGFPPRAQIVNESGRSQGGKPGLPAPVPPLPACRGKGPRVVSARCRAGWRGLSHP